MANAREIQMWETFFLEREIAQYSREELDKLIIKT